jgi:ribose 5-phosphate isomerase B
MLFITSDHAGYELKNEIKTWLIQNSFEFIDIAPTLMDTDDYTDRATDLIAKIDTSNTFGIAICGTGQGICMTLNRSTKIRAVLPPNAEIASLTRAHNDANILCLPGRFYDIDTCAPIIQAFLTTKFSNEPRHIQRLNKIS